MTAGTMRDHAQALGEQPGGRAANGVDHDAEPARRCALRQGSPRWIVIVDGLGSAVASGPLRALGGDRRNDPGAGGGSHRHDQLARDPAGAVHEDRVVGPAGGRGNDLQGSEERHRQCSGDRPFQLGRHPRHVGGVRHEPLGPCPLIAERRTVDEDAVAGYETGHSRPDDANDTRRLHAQSHRRPDAHVPPAGPHEVVPVADPGCLHIDQDLVSGRGGRLGQHEGFHGSALRPHAGSSHQAPFARSDCMERLRHGGPVSQSW